MRSLRGRSNLLASAETRVRETLGGEILDHRVVHRKPFRLADWRGIPCDSDGCQIGQVRALVLGSAGYEIEVFDAHNELAIKRSRPLMGDHRGAQIAEM